jgi:hypothetical protein
MLRDEELGVHRRSGLDLDRLVVDHRQRRVLRAGVDSRLPSLPRIYRMLGVRSPPQLARLVVSTTPGKLPGIPTAGVNTGGAAVSSDPSEQFERSFCLEDSRSSNHFSHPEFRWEPSVGREPSRPRSQDGTHIRPPRADLCLSGEVLSVPRAQSQDIGRKLVVFSGPSAIAVRHRLRQAAEVWGPKCVLPQA